jgi:predicted glycosyltransferase
MDLNRSRANGDGFRFLFYSHDGLGLGHVRRNLAIAAALTSLSPGSSVLLVTGSDEVGQLGLCSCVETLKLPSLQKVRNGEYTARRLPVSSSEILRLRARLLEAAVKSFQPDVLLVDKHPLGANGELRRPLEHFRARGGRTVLGLRDILDDRRAVLAEWNAENWRQHVEDYFEAVLVYGQRNLFDPIREYLFSDAMMERTRFCGYVVNSLRERWSSAELPARNPKRQRRPIVLATTGGGEDGFELLRAFIEASRQGEWDGVIVTGPMSRKAEHGILQQLAGEAGIAFHTFVPQLDEWFTRVDAVVCMSGYNTMAETVSRGARVVVVPRSKPRTEQLIRARLFAQLGLVRLVEPDRFTVQELGKSIRSVLRVPKEEIAARTRAELDFGGGCRAAAFLLKMAAERSLKMAPEQAPTSQARQSAYAL